MLTNATVVDDAIRFVSEKSKGKTIFPSSNSNEDENKSNEPDYHKDKDQLEEQEEENKRNDNKSSFLNYY